MGFEVQLLIGEVAPTIRDKFDEASWFRVYASVDLCKPGHNSEVVGLYELKTDEKFFFYSPAGDGDSEHTEDSYGKANNPLPVAAVLYALKQDNERDPYRRFTWAINLLEAMDADESLDAKVIIWGY